MAGSLSGVLGAQQQLPIATTYRPGQDSAAQQARQPATGEQQSFEVPQQSSNTQSAPAVQTQSPNTENQNNFQGQDSDVAVGNTQEFSGDQRRGSIVDIAV